MDPHPPHTLTPLRSIPTGRTATLAEISGPRTFRRRLLELGLLPGTRVQLLRRSEMHNLVELSARGCHLTLRHSEAKYLLVDLDS